jgi:hypothetical protein
MSLGETAGSSVPPVVGVDAESFSAPTPRTRFLWWAAGADPSILESIDCPASERRFFAGIGAAVCLTVALAGFAAWLASGMVFPAPLDAVFGLMTPIREVGRVASSLLLMLVFFNLQRFLLGVAGRRSDWDGGSQRDVLRMALVLLVTAGVSFAIATPLQVAASEPAVRMRALAIAQLERIARVPTLDTSRAAGLADLFSTQAKLESSISARQSAPAAGDPLLPGASAAQRLPFMPPACGESLESCLVALDAPEPESPQRTVNPVDGSIDRELQSLRRALDGQSRALLRTKLQTPHLNDSPVGLVGRAALAYEGNALLCAVVFGLVFLLVSIPLVFRLLADRSPYDLLVRYRNEWVLAHRGIEPRAYEIVDREGERHTLDEFSEPRQAYQRKIEEVLAERRGSAAARQAAFEARAKDILGRG